jgi:hypothetical protein
MLFQPCLRIYLNSRPAVTVCVCCAIGAHPWLLKYVAWQHRVPFFLSPSPLSPAELYHKGCQNHNITQSAVFLSWFFAFCCMFPFLAATVDLRACATTVAVGQFAVHLVLILRVDSRLRIYWRASKWQCAGP